MKSEGDSYSLFRNVVSSVPGFMDLLGARKKVFICWSKGRHRGPTYCPRPQTPRTAWYPGPSSPSGPAVPHHSLVAPVGTKALHHQLVTVTSLGPLMATMHSCSILSWVRARLACNKYNCYLLSVLTQPPFVPEFSGGRICAGMWWEHQWVTSLWWHIGNMSPQGGFVTSFIMSKCWL